MPTQDGYEYVYQNAGFQPLTPGTVGYETVYSNFGIAPLFIYDGFEYAWEGDVNTATPTPHIWFVSPTSGRAGDGAVIYGHGMGVDVTTYSGAVDILYEDTGWAGVSITNWAFVSETTDSYGPIRAISPSTLAINVEHVKIEVLIPTDAEPPGQQVRFRTDGP